MYTTHINNCTFHLNIQRNNVRHEHVELIIINYHEHFRRGARILGERKKYAAPI
jgi:hypothetical protein